MNVWIVAIDHFLQLSRAESDSDKLRAQKEHLEAILQAGISEWQIDFIAEESIVGGATIALDLANINSPAIPWINIIMTHDERDAVGIREALDNRPGGPDWETMTYWIEQRVPEDDVREDFFVERTLSQAQNARSVLMILGDMHVEAVGEKLRQRGYTVTTNHELCPVKRWEDIRDC